MNNLAVPLMVSRINALDNATPNVVALSWVMWGMTFAANYPEEASKFYTEIKEQLKLRTGDPLEVIEREFEQIARYIAVGD